MKIFNTIFSLFLLVAVSPQLFSQDNDLLATQTVLTDNPVYEVTTHQLGDTAIANNMLKRANYLYSVDLMDSVAILANQASQIFQQTEVWEDYVDAQLLLSTNHFLTSEKEDASQITDDVLKFSLENLGEKHPATARAYIQKGIIDLGNLDSKDALENFSTAHNILTNTKGQSLTIARLYSLIGFTHSTFNEDSKKALNYCETTIAILRNALDGSDSELAKAYSDVARLYQDLGQTEKALGLYNQALNIYYRNYSQSMAAVASINYNIGKIKSELEDYEGAVASYEKAIELLMMTIGEDNRLAVNIYSNLGQTYLMKLKDRAKALPNLKKAIVLDKQVKLSPSDDLTYRYRVLGKYYVK